MDCGMGRPAKGTSPESVPAAFGPNADIRMGVLACTGTLRGLLGSEEILRIITPGIRPNVRKPGFWRLGSLNKAKKCPSRTTPFLTANIWTYRDGEGCGIQLSGYAPVMRPARP